jgi:hypothetical protein
MYVTASMKNNNIEPNGVIMVTQTMLDKSIIDANKTVQEYMKWHWEVGYAFLEAGEHFTVPMKHVQDDIEYVLNVKFYKSKGRGDKRISIEKLRNFAQAGDLVTLWVDKSKDESVAYIDIEHDPFG